MTTANFPVNGPVVLDVVGTELTEDDVRRIRHPLTGMVILFTRNYESPDQLSALTAAVHAVKPGVLIGVDHEGGRVQRFRSGFTEIPAMHAYGDLWQENPQAATRALTAAGVLLRMTPAITGISGSSARIRRTSSASSPSVRAAPSPVLPPGLIPSTPASKRRRKKLPRQTSRCHGS